MDEPNANRPDSSISFRLAMRRMASTISIISTTDDSGQRFGMVATSVSSVSMDPPTLLICVNRAASIHAPLLQQRRFCVNVLTPEQRCLVAAFSGHLKGEDRFTLGRWTAHERWGLPSLEAAQANIACTVEKCIEMGTHSVLIASVICTQVADAVDPLIYVDGQLSTVAALAA